jgi:hypothetical protein
MLKRLLQFKMDCYLYTRQAILRYSCDAQAQCNLGPFFVVSRWNLGWTEPNPNRFLENKANRTELEPVKVGSIRSLIYMYTCVNIVLWGNSDQKFFFPFCFSPLSFNQHDRDLVFGSLTRTKCPLSTAERIIKKGCTRKK